MNDERTGGWWSSRHHVSQILLKKYHNIMSSVDLCASAFTEIPDTCVCGCVYTFKKTVKQRNIKFVQVFTNLLTMLKFYHFVHHVFGGWVVVENNTEHYTQVFYDCKLMRRPLTLTGGFVEGRVGRVIRCEQKRATREQSPT